LLAPWDGPKRAFGNICKGNKQEEIIHGTNQQRGH
jgi:hypothetical protein